MALTPETFEVLKQSREYLLQRSNDVTHDLTQAWVGAWDSIQPELEAAARGLAGSDPRAALLARRAAMVGDAAGVLVSDALYAAGEPMSSAMVAAVANAEKQQILAASTQVPPDQAASFGASLNRVDPLQLEAIVMRGTEAIMVGWSAMPDYVQSAVRTNLFKGVAFGLHPTVVARQIMDNAQGAFAGGLSRAIRVARTEMLDAHRNASGAWRQSNKDVLAGWRWLATLDTRTCPSCLAKNGNLYKVEDPGPLDHPNGRCDAVPETKSWKDLGIDGVEEPPSTFPDARAWYDGLSPEAQKSIMGPGRQALLADGKVGWDDLSTRVSSKGWRDSYTTTSLKDLQKIEARPSDPNEWRLAGVEYDSMPYELKRMVADRKYLADYPEETQALLEKHMRDLMTEAVEAPIKINVNSEAAESILKQGRFRTAHEAGLKSGGWKKGGEYRKARVKYETEIVGVPPGTAGAHKPISGWSTSLLGDPDMYGDVQFVLKDSVKGRTTWTFGDSLNSSARPISADEILRGNRDEIMSAGNRSALDYILEKPGAGFGAKPVRTELEDITQERVFKSIAYTETQVYGGVSLSDVDHVVLKKGTHSPSLEASMRAAGVAVRWLS